MAFHNLGFATLKHQNLFLCKILNKSTHFPKPFCLLGPKLTISCSHSNHNVNVMSKRMFNIFIATTFTFSDSILSNFSISIAEPDQELQLQRYTDSTEGFTLLIPSSYIKVEKPGATVLFQELDKGSNNIGVVVNPVKISKLSEFGTPEFVADKLIKAEKKKESTKDAEVVAVSERSGQQGLQVYEFEYSLDSTRGGLKRVFTAAFVASKKLYLLNIANSDSLENPIDSQTRNLLKQVIHSFDVCCIGSLASLRQEPFRDIRA
ncbi:hypothetical protein LIER_04464 [Lithospermum erythrorhizon]|uniref:PsbP C-terminal domain-containing protein n=1 Tax=Lithospermum erythrorhizon TaxID=34254 RepID=A0AAV3NX88_LITER